MRVFTRRTRWGFLGGWRTSEGEEEGLEELAGEPMAKNELVYGGECAAIMFDGEIVLEEQTEADGYQADPGPSDYRIILCPLARCSPVVLQQHRLNGQRDHMHIHPHHIAYHHRDLFAFN